MISLFSRVTVRTRSQMPTLGIQVAKDLYDAAMRLVGDISGELFEDVTCVALQAGVAGVKEELINIWQQ